MSGIFFYIELSWKSLVFFVFQRRLCILIYSSNYDPLIFIELNDFALSCVDRKIFCYRCLYYSMYLLIPCDCKFIEIYGASHQIFDSCSKRSIQHSRITKFYSCQFLSRRSYSTRSAFIPEEAPHSSLLRPSLKSSNAINSLHCRLGWNISK